MNHGEELLVTLLGECDQGFVPIVSRLGIWMRFPFHVQGPIQWDEEQKEMRQFCSTPACIGSFRSNKQITLQAHEVAEELAVDVDHPAPGVAEVAFAGLREHSGGEVMRDLQS